MTTDNSEEDYGNNMSTNQETRNNDKNRDYGPSPNNNNKDYDSITREKEETNRHKITTWYEVFLRLRDLVILLIYLGFILISLRMFDYDIEKVKELSFLVLPVVTLVLGIEKNKDK